MTTAKPTVSAMPKPMSKVEAHLYAKIRTLHCERKAGTHDCIGRVTLDQHGLTLQCPRCGDVRSLYPVQANDE